MKIADAIANDAGRLRRASRIADVATAPSSDPDATQKYRKSCPVVTARISANAKGTVAAAIDSE